MIFRKYKINQKLISAILVVLILIPVLSFSVAKKVFAQESASACLAATAAGIGGGAVGTIAGGITGSVPTYSKVEAKIATITAGSTTSIENYKKKECLKEVLRDILKIAAKRLLAQMTESTVNWINTGFHGQPLFLENPGSFFKDIAKSEIKNLVNIIGHDSVKQPFGKSTAINIINSYKSTFQQNAQYSLSKVTNDPILLERFRNDFSVGGWDGFLLQTQFPQNNYIGYNIMVADEQARRTAGTSLSQTDIIKATVEQGQGFLSPQTCPSNPKYNNLKNQFNRPTFKCTVPQPARRNCSVYAQGDIPPPPGSPSSSGMTVSLCQSINNAAEFSWKQKCNAEQATWDQTNSCPGGLVNTTPGSVVGASIMKAITGPYDQTSLAAAMGNSLSAIFDALLNKFMSSGLSSLSNKLSGTGSSNNDDDNFDYYGHTLGTSPNNTGNGGFDWGGPDEIIVLSTFKRDVQSAIDNGNKELRLIDSTAVPNTGVNEFARIANTPGILQTFENIWPKTAELDMCLPGPNIGWQDRVDEGAQETIAASATTDSSFSSTVNSFKEWVANKINIELPGSRNYLSAVNSIKTINEQAANLTARGNVITETLIKLESIKAEMSSMAVEPNPGSAGEATLVRLKQRYNGMLSDLSTSASVTEAQNKLADAKDKLTSLGNLLARCSAERTAKGWTNPGGENSRLNNSSTEKTVFCSSYPETPPVSCDVVFRTNISDYKK
jgi:hypothetical protein